MNRLAALSIGLAVVALTTASGRANEEPQQKYTNWQQHPTAKYWYCSYQYKPVPTAEKYLYHYVIWNPAYPDYCYCYNPTTKVYYGRWDRSACGKEGCHLGKNPHGYYSIAKEQQKGTIGEIPETAFSARSAAPRIPTDAGNPAPVAPSANPPAGNPPTVSPPGGNPPTVNPPTVKTPPPANPPAGPNPPPAGTNPPPKPPQPANPPSPPPGTGAPPSAPGTPPSPPGTPPVAPAANTNPQIQPPPDLPQEAAPGSAPQ